ncbi:antitermination protein [Escherichia coli]|uniref:antitermination protein Q n=1 Tax=Escherichia coli TaxID=562 RepID=UPI00390C2953
MAAMGMAQSQAGFSMAAFCGKHELSQNDKQKGYQLSDAICTQGIGKYRGVAKLEGNTKAKVLQVLATFAYADYCRSAATPGQDAEIAMVQAVRLILPKQSCGKLSRKSAEDAKASAIQGCQQAQPAL